MRSHPVYQNLKDAHLPEGFRGRSALVTQLWWIIELFLFRLSPQFLYGWRRFLLRLFGAKIGKNFLIRPTAHITYPWKVNIGDYSWVGDDVVLYSLGNIYIGKNVAIAQRSYFCTGLHNYNVFTFDISSEPITICDQVWITTDVFVGPGVTIGEGSVVGSRSSVFNDLPAGMICFGNPAIAIKPRSHS